jgi:outer membrane protein OmpA-like peptidoglycan-associated protein
VGIAALALGIVTLVLALIPCISGYAAPLAVLATILGLLGIHDRRERAFAIAGLACGAVATLIACHGVYLMMSAIEDRPIVRRDAPVRVAETLPTAAPTGEPATRRDVPPHVGRGDPSAEPDDRGDRVAPPTPELPTPIETTARFSAGEIEHRFSRLIKSGAVEVTERRGTVVLVLPTDDLFAAETALLTEEGKRILREVGFAKMPGVALAITAHTEPRDDGDTLSAARANAALAMLRKAGQRAEATAVGRGDRDPIAPGNSPRNRRLEIALEATGRTSL